MDPSLPSVDDSFDLLKESSGALQQKNWAGWADAILFYVQALPSAFRQLPVPVAEQRGEYQESVHGCFMNDGY